MSQPLGQARLEMVPEPRGDCFKLWVIKSRSCFRHSPRSHIGDALWNSEPDSRHQFSQCFWSAFLVFRKMRFRTESAKTYHPKHTPQGSSFWPYGEVVTSQIWMIMSYISMRQIPHMNESCSTYMNDSCRTGVFGWLPQAYFDYSRSLSLSLPLSFSLSLSLTHTPPIYLTCNVLHTWRSHDACMKQLRHTYEWVMSYI